MRPLFLFSLPRTGSTLVQRVLGAHPEISTTSEPWLLLPLLYSLREEGARAEYWHVATAQALKDFCDELPGGRQDYLDELRELANRLYRRAAGDSVAYFLDKTPHYHLIVKDVIDLFPDARFIFLWRNPLAVTASLLSTFRAGRWEPAQFEVDLQEGVQNLTEGWKASKGRACAVSYEALLNGDSEWRRLFQYLDLEFTPDLLSQFDEVRLSGRYGDPSGTRDYSRISSEPLGKWQAAVRSPVRRAWCRRYLMKIGDDQLELMGYDRHQILADLSAVRGGHWRVPHDLYRLSASRIAANRRRRALSSDDSPRPTSRANPAAPFTRLRAAARRRLRDRARNRARVDP